MTEGRKPVGYVVLDGQNVAEILDWQIKELKSDGTGVLEQRIRLTHPMSRLDFVGSVDLRDLPAEETCANCRHVVLDDRGLFVDCAAPKPCDASKGFRAWEAQDPEDAALVKAALAGGDKPEPESDGCWNCRHPGPSSGNSRCGICPHIDETGARVWKLWEARFVEVAPDPAPGVDSDRGDPET
jgi:hypothetical protein